MHRLYSPTTLASGQTLTLNKEQSHYIGNVLRVKEQQELIVFDGSGAEFQCNVAQARKSEFVINIGEARYPNTESPLKSCLVQSVMRGERMDFCIQKATELGVHEIAPVLSERSVVKLKAERRKKRQEHWQKIARSAAEQCGRVRVPTVQTPVLLSEFLDEQRLETATLVYLSATREATQLSHIQHDPESALFLIVGPEGGFNDVEREHMQARGAHAINLGPRVFRSETAGFVSLALCQSMWGDLVHRTRKTIKPND